MRKNSGSKFGTIVFALVVLIILFFIFNIYKENYFGSFLKAEYIPNLSEFKRDRTIKQGKFDSFRIDSYDFNDAMIYKEVEVKPNTPYRVSCMVKTQDIVSQKNTSSAGALICINGTTEACDGIKGTQDWQKIEFMFNSKSRDKVQIGFRLGSNGDNCKGTAWFSDLKLEIGSKSKDTNWKSVCFIFPNLDVNIEQNGKKTNVKENMTATDIEDMKSNMERLKNTVKRLSGYKMTMDYDIIEINEPITSVSIDKENGYYIAPEDIASVIKPFLQKTEYDYIFVAVKLGSILHEEPEDGGDWVGLGGMDYNDIGFSNIRLPNKEKSYIYKYDPSRNIFPEEAFIHEFLHTLERNSQEYGLSRPALHDHLKYGYEVKPRTGLQEWYGDYMTKNINTPSGKIGLEPEVYSLKPVHKDSFKYSMELNFQEDPKNIIEEFRAILRTIGNAGKKIQAMKGTT